MSRVCRIAGDATIPVIDLGEQFVSNFVEKDQIHSGDKAPLRLCLSPKSGFLQLEDSYPPEKMYAEYWYHSSTNEQMREELDDVVKSCLKWRSVEPGDLVLDIASNDGYMLTCYPKELLRIGVDPSDVAAKSKLYGAATTAFVRGRDRMPVYSGTFSGPVLINDFFSEGALRQVTKQQAKIVTICAMFYDLEDPRSFLEQVNNIMAKDGLLAIQMSYLPLMLQQNAFDNIGHEHLGYYSFSTLFDLLVDTGFDPVDVELNVVNGGSFIVYAAKMGSPEDDPDYFTGDLLSQPRHVLDLGQMRIHALTEYESSLDLGNPETYISFLQRVGAIRKDILDFLYEAKDAGKRVVGYGASTKGNTLLQWCAIGPDLIESIAERSPAKIGKYTPGSGIPIISEEEMRENPPDYLFVFPWTFINTMMRREADLIAQGTRFVVPLPELRIY